MPPAVGAVLVQHDRPVAYYSRKLTDAEVHYSASDIEMLAVICALGEWRCYVEGAHFTIVTDHRPNTYLDQATMRTRSKDARAGLTFLAAMTMSGSTALVVLMLLTLSHGLRNTLTRFARVCLSCVRRAQPTQRAPVGRRLALVRALLQVPHRRVIYWVSFHGTAVFPLRCFVGTLTSMQALLVMLPGRQHKEGGVTHPLCSLRIQWCSSG